MDTDTAIKAPTPRKRAPRKPAQPKFQPVVSSDGKSVLPPDVQQHWLEWYNSKKPAEQAVIVETLTMVLPGSEVNRTGYRAFFRTVRVWIQLGILATKPITARF